MFETMVWQVVPSGAWLEGSAARAASIGKSLRHRKPGEPCHDDRAGRVRLSHAWSQALTENR